MEVTSVALRSVILIFLCAAKAHGQTSLQSPQTEAAGYASSSSNRAQAQASASSIGLSQKLIMPPNPVGINPNAFQQMPLSGLQPTIQYATAMNDNGLSPPRASLIKSLFCATVNLMYFVMASLDLSDADRHTSLRDAAYDINNALDTLVYYVENLRKLRRNLLRDLENIPVLGFLVQVAANIIYIITYIPLQILRVIKSLIRRIFERPPQDIIYPSMPGVAYPYA